MPEHINSPESIAKRSRSMEATVKFASIENPDKVCAVNPQEISQIQNGLKNLEQNLKEFIEMQCAMDEEILNFFEAFLIKMGDIVTQSSPSVSKEKEEKLEEYGILANIDREKFFALLSYLDSVKSAGILILEISKNPSLPLLKIQISQGDIISLQYIHQNEDSEIKKCSQEFEKFRSQHWKTYTEEQLRQIFIDMISAKTQYLGGVSRVIHQMTMEQILNKVSSLCPPLFQVEKDQSYTGEAVFHYVMLKWPQKGLGILKAKFSEKEFSITSKNIKISIAYLSRISQAFLEKYMLTPKRLPMIEENSKP